MRTVHGPSDDQHPRPATARVRSRRRQVRSRAEQHQRGDQQGDEEQPFAAHHRRQRRSATPRSSGVLVGPGPEPPVGGEDHEPGRQDEQALGEEHAVDDPQVRVRARRASPRASSPDRRPPDGRSGRRRARHRCRRGSTPFGDRRSSSRRAGRRRRGRREARPVQGARDRAAEGDPVERLDEAAALGEQVRGRVVEERVAAVRLGRSDRQQGDDPHHEPAADDHRQAVARRPTVRVPPDVTRRRRRRHERSRGRDRHQRATTGSGGTQAPVSTVPNGACLAPLDVLAEDQLGHRLVDDDIRRGRTGPSRRAPWWPAPGRAQRPKSSHRRDDDEHQEVAARSRRHRSRRDRGARQRSRAVAPPTATDGDDGERAGSADPPVAGGPRPPAPRASEVELAGNRASGPSASG